MTKLDEDAKRENEQNRRKVKHEEKQADYNSPEEFRKTGGDVNPTQKLTPSQPDPKNDESLAGTRYDPNTNGAKE